MPNVKVEDLFGGNDATVKYVLEGHDRGVNWAAFHHTLPLIVSGADDRQVKLWRMNETKAWEVDTLRGHINNVSCALFHPKQELIVSNSEDKSIRVWDMSKRQGVQTFRREHDRFWILAAHQDSNLLAAGHDGGMLVFKLERERPAYTPQPHGVLFLRDRYVRTYEYSSGKETPLMSIRRAASGGSTIARSIHYNEQESMLLLSLDAEGGSYELYQVPKDSASADAVVTECKRGTGSSAVFVARQRFAVLDKNRQILVKNFQNEVTKKCAPPHPSTDQLFAAGTGSLLLRSEERISLYDIQQRKALADVSVGSVVKYVVWSHDGAHVALICKHTIVICTKKLEQLCTVHDTIRIKSGVWDGNDLFYFTTLNHLKYCLTNGDTGIIRTLEVPLYLTSASNGKLHCLDREGKMRKLMVDSTECSFKLCLHKKEFEKVVRIIKQSKLAGHAIIAYLQKKGYPQVALHFVCDEQTRFNLAVDCGNIDVALTAAYALDSHDNWERLGAEALKHGNLQIVEMAYQRTKDMQRLSFLYAMTGNIDKLRKMLKIAEMRSDVMSRFHNALYLGDASERVRLLAEAGHLPLAYLAATTHGLTEQAEMLGAQLEGAGLPLPQHITISPLLLYPPLPIFRDANWPLLTITRDTFTHGIGDGSQGGAFGVAAAEECMDDNGGGGGDGWGDDIDDIDFDGGDKPSGAGGGSFGDDIDPIAGDSRGEGEGEGEGGGWGDDLDLDLGDVQLAEGSGAVSGGGGFYVAPTAHLPAAARWTRDSIMAADHVAAGSFESAMQTMRRTLGIRDFTPLKNIFVTLASASHATMSGLPNAPPLLVPLTRSGGTLPRLCISLPGLVERLKAAYTLVTAGKFPEALEAFTGLVSAATLCVVEVRQQVGELRELVSICQRYILATRVEMTRKQSTDAKRQIELAAYFTHCGLQPSHTVLALRAAMTQAYKAKLLISAGSFARRLLELNPKPDYATQARKVIQLSEQTPGDAFTYAYDERNPFVLCNAELVPIYRGSPLVQCTLCKAHYLPLHKGELCATCRLGEVGGEAAGFDEAAVLSRSSE